MLLPAFLKSPIIWNRNNKGTFFRVFIFKPWKEVPFLILLSYTTFLYCFLILLSYTVFLYVYLLYRFIRHLFNSITFLPCFSRLSCHKEHDQEQNSDNPGSYFDIFRFSGKETNHNTCNNTKCNTIRDIIGKWHKCNNHKSRNCFTGRKPVDFSYAVHHQHTNIDQCCCSCTTRNQRCNRTEEHCNKE